MGAGAVLAAKTPLGRLGRCSDIAPLAVFLASDESAWITGESFGPRAASLWPLECDVLTPETEKAGPNMDVQRSTALRRSDGLSAIASLRHHWPEYLMEVGEVGLYLFVACVVTTLLDHPASIVRQSIPSGVARRALMGLVMGATAIAIVISRWGKRSGGHFNPAITFTFYRLGKVEFWDTWFYVIAQFLGAMSGVALAKYMLRGALAHDAVRYAVTVPGMYGSTVAFVAELAISFFLMITVLCATNQKRLAPYTAYFVGVLIVIYYTFEAPLSGMSTNPARTFGSALHANDWHALWIYFIAPSMGMLAAGEVFLRVRRGAAPYCAKLHHANHERCIFHHAQNEV